jgi:hypothetical protein
MYWIYLLTAHAQGDIYENIWNTKMFINERSDHVYMSVYNFYVYDFNIAFFW